ncbi:UNVERIFIED_CONTAM: hypothetical protein PYX00_003356 [Menopon gallinae]
MRSPGGSVGRSASPSSPKNRAKTTESLECTADKNPSKDLECNVRQAQFALKHFRDVINKNKLEMLPGNGTVVLETVTAIHVLLKKYVLNEQSSTLVSATNQIYQSLAKLIKLCDDYLLIGDKALSKENVSDVVNQVESAIQNLVALTRDKLAQRESNGKVPAEATANHVAPKPRTLSEKNSLDLSQRSSLPDIPLTPSEKEILERTSVFVLERHSQSSENVLSDTPPPKPPHPDRVDLDPSYPPPLPPKKRQRQFDEICAVKNSVDCLSLRSKSPEDSSSLLSASAGSLDSVLNHSRDEEDEMRVLMDHPEDSDHVEELSTHIHQNGGCPTFCWDNSCIASREQVRLLNSSAALSDTVDSPVFVPFISTENTFKMDRFSGSQAESGFCSMPSRRSSCQSYSASSQQLSSTRSSQQSYTSQESHHTETKMMSSDTSKFQSFVSENQKIISSSSSSEKLSCQKQTVFKKCSDLGGDLWQGNDSPVKKVTSCHSEVKIHECHLHASSVSPVSLKTSPKRLSPCHDSAISCPEEDKPPALPEKTRVRSVRRERHPSQYDNMCETVENSHEKTCVLSQIQTDGVFSLKQESSSTTQSSLTVENSSGGVTSVFQSESVNGSIQQKKTAGSVEQIVHTVEQSVVQTSSVSPDGKPPPLPPKKKPIMAYMEIFGNASHSNSNEFLRHSVHASNMLHSEWHPQQKIITSTQSCSFNITTESNQSTPKHAIDIDMVKSSIPPALPPKKSRNRSTTSSPPTTPPAVPDSNTKTKPLTAEEKEVPAVVTTEPVPEPDNSRLEPPPASEELEEKEKASNNGNKEGEIFLLDKLDVSQYLVFKKTEDGGPDIRGGHPDALIIHATKAHKNDFVYEEAFLTTYRTFMTPLELIQKLCYRYEKFSNSQDSQKQRASRESFALLVRVVSDLTLSDLEQVVLQTLMEFVQQLLCRGDLTMAKALRVIMLKKYEAKKFYLTMNSLLPSHSISTRQSVLLDFKSEQIAEQMTLLDAELFLKIEIPEVLTWAQEQSEERSPNLTRFTEHFNKMSYWARSRILEQNEAKDREKYLVKFIKIMKHLRKINNFNSYLALLSALDSAPIRRLEWQKHITEGLKEYCALIDSSSSFRAYRQALADTEPPCIPYIGLVLQDLTFVHIGNTNLLTDGSINFSKRWQQYDIVQNMKRFKTGSYPYKKNERIISFFNGFDESLSEEAMWQISEKIKPRGGKKL